MILTYLNREDNRVTLILMIKAPLESLKRTKYIRKSKSKSPQYIILIFQSVTIQCRGIFQSTFQMSNLV